MNDDENDENGNAPPVSREATEAAEAAAATGNAEAFGPPRVVGGRLVFVYREDEARRVRVSGEFNGWNPAHGVFARQPDGTWRLEIDPPAAGRYRYRFLVDDTRWIEDPSNDVKEANPYGSMDSVLVVELREGEGEGEGK